MLLRRWWSRLRAALAEDRDPPLMIDRLIHHAEILSLKGDSYRLRDKDLGAPPPADID